MKIYNKLVISMITGEVLEEDSNDYSGPIAWARGGETSSQKQASAAAEAEREKQDAYNQQLFTQQQADRARLLPQYQSIYDTPMSAEERGAGLATAGGPFDAAQTVAEHRAGVTGNYSGLGENEDQLARSRSQALSQERGQQDATSMGRKIAALQGMSQLYGIDAQTMARLMGIPVEYLNTQAGIANEAARNPSFLDQLALTTLSAAGGIGAAYAKK
ncbi:MAG TPA: hypothetical protein VK738_04290 [Terriglobales bacterium]|jgi:hypothetical protein|nr:hypothetical protein [Terriglobales bacterium]